MSENLYELSKELAVIKDELIESGGVLDDDLERRLDECGLAFNEKVLGIARWRKNLDGKVSALDDEISRLTARKKAAEALQERLKNYIQMCMELADRQKVEFDTFTIWLQGNPPSAKPIDEKATPAKYMTIIPAHKEPDKKAILEALKKGEKVEGWELVTNKKHLRIK